MTSAATQKLDPLIYEFDSVEEEEKYTAWLRAKVEKALADPRPAIPHDEAVARLDAIIAKAMARKAN